MKLSVLVFPTSPARITTGRAYRTNRMIDGRYISQLERGSPAIDPSRMDVYLASHLLDPILLRTDSFEGFMLDRQKRPIALIESAPGKATDPAASQCRVSLWIEGSILNCHFICVNAGATYPLGTGQSSPPVVCGMYPLVVG